MQPALTDEAARALLMVAQRADNRNQALLAGAPAQASETPRGISWLQIWSYGIRMRDTVVPVACKYARSCLNLSQIDGLLRQPVAGLLMLPMHTRDAHILEY